MGERVDGGPWARGMSKVEVREVSGSPGASVVNDAPELGEGLDEVSDVSPRAGEVDVEDGGNGG